MADVKLSKVYLLRVDLEKDYKHTFYFSSETEQRNYFLDSRDIKKFEDFSYQRKDNKIRVPLYYDEALKYNYVMYQNTSYSSKWYYAFITDHEFKGDDQTDITIETDVMQTWLFDYYVHDSFIEREHVKDDTIGANTVPEGLEMGEYIPKYQERVEELLDLWNVVAVTSSPHKDEESGKYPTASNVFDGLYSGVGYLAFPGATGVEKIITTYDKEGRADAISSMFMYPSIFIDSFLKRDPTLEATYGNASVIGSTTHKTLAFTMNKTAVYNYSSLGYEPKNNKLKSYPYLYLNVSNNNGGSAIYEFEHFKNNNVCDFEIHSCICPGGSVRLIPKNYKNLLYNEEEGLNLGKFAIGNWASDAYTNWLTQNGVNIALNMASGLGQIVAGSAIAVGSGGVGMAVGGGSVVGGVSTIANQLAQIHQMSMTPPQAQGNLNCGDIITASKENTFTFYTMTIKPEYMRIIDGFFTAYGYKVNRIKTPYKNHRSRFWYTKTIDVNLYSATIPQYDLQKIKDCYNNGITFWKDRERIGDYSSDNSIV